MPTVNKGQGRSEITLNLRRIFEVRRKKTSLYGPLIQLIDDLEQESSHPLDIQDVLDRILSLRSILDILEDSLLHRLDEKRRKSREPR